MTPCCAVPLPSRRTRRAFSFLLYLNPRWDAARDGGALRCGAPLAPAEQRRRAAPDADGRGTWVDLEVQRGERRESESARERKRAQESARERKRAREWNSETAR